jgi:hypothetical protein
LAAPGIHIFETACIALLPQICGVGFANVYSQTRQTLCHFFWHRAKVYTSELESWFLAASDIHIFETACIALLPQICGDF